MAMCYMPASQHKLEIWPFWTGSLSGSAHLAFRANKLAFYLVAQLSTAMEMCMKADCFYASL